MPLPDKKSAPTPESIKQLHDGLTAMISDHPGVVDNCSFYVAIDEYLGPWGDSGYPIGYGLFYCRLFGNDNKLQADPIAAEWVRNTRIKLQDFLRDIIVNEYRSGKLSTLSKEALKEAAFDSHPRAYEEGGLRRVVQLRPGLIEVIAVIPSREFNPKGDTFGATIKQVAITGFDVGLDLIGRFIVTPLNEGEDEALNQMRLPSTLDRIGNAIDQGKLDNISMLDTVISVINSRAYPDGNTRGKALLVIQKAQHRIEKVKAYYAKINQESPNAAPEIKALLLDLCRGSYCSVSSSSTLNGLQGNVGGRVGAGANRSVLH